MVAAADPDAAASVTSLLAHLLTTIIHFIAASYDPLVSTLFHPGYITKAIYITTINENNAEH